MNSLVKHTNGKSPLKAIHEIGKHIPIGESITLTKHRNGVTVRGTGKTTLVVGPNKTRIYRTIDTV